MPVIDTKYRIYYWLTSSRGQATFQNNEQLGNIMEMLARKVSQYRLTYASMLGFGRSAVSLTCFSCSDAQLFDARCGLYFILGNLTLIHINSFN